MAFLPSLQEGSQSHTGGVVFFRTGQDKNLGERLGSDLSEVRQDYLEFSQYWGGSNTLRYMLEGVTAETKAISSTILFEPFPSKISVDELRWKTWAGHILASPGFTEK